jgi:hypothetical protein
MKNYFLTCFFMFLFLFSFGQEWHKYLPEIDKTELTLYDYQDAFNKYWRKFDVINGRYTDETGKILKAYGWKQFKRWEHYWSTRVDLETGKFPKNEMHEAHKMYMQDLKNSKEDVAWQSLGPDASDGGYAGIGRLNTIAFHPSDVNTYWVGAPAGGIWVTSTGGNDWTCLNNNTEILGVSAIVIPSDYETSNTIYIGTGDRDAFDNHSIGVLKSTDGGSTWNLTGLTFNPSSGDVVNQMLIHPADDETIFAATSDGLFKTTNAGVDWTELTSLEYVDIEFHPTNPSILYGSTRSGRIYKSSNSGDDWTQIFQSNSSRRIELAVTLDDPERIYVLAANTSNGLEGIYRSDNAGEEFTLIFDDLYLLNWSSQGTGTNNGQGWYDLSLAADPTNGDVVYVGGVNTWKSTDAGENFTISNYWSSASGVQTVHADKHYFKFRPGTSELYECNDGGVYVTNDGVSWTDLSNTLVISQIYGLSTAQTESDVTIIGLQDNGTKYRNNGVWEDVIGGDGMKCLVDHEDAAVQYGSLYYGQIYRTGNYWASSVYISNNIPGGAAGSWVTPYVLDPNNSDVLYVGYSSLWKSQDKGNSFESLGTFGALNTIDVAEASSETICIGTVSTLHISTNGGLTWENITSGLPSHSKTDVEFKFDDPNTLWVSLGGYNADGVYQSVNGGESWTDISAGLPEIPVNTLIQNKLESGEVQLYAGTDFGVYIKNGDSDWELYGSDLPKVVVTELDIYYDLNAPENSRLRISTYGRGLWEAPLELSGNFAPLVNSVDVFNITENSATASASLDNDYGSTITQSGFIVHTSQNFNLETPGVLIFNTDPIVSEGSFSLELPGLVPSTVYYCKAFAVNENGTGYGNILSFNTDCAISSDLPFIHNFENDETLPICWEEEIISGDAFWKFGDLPIYDAYEGEVCAYKDDITNEDDLSYLILPQFNFTSYSNIKLNFWHIQPAFFSEQDELEVLYKSDYQDSWSVLETYDQDVGEWIFRSISLPNLSDDYHIAFAANTKNGKGVGVDLISIEESIDINDREKDRIRILPNPTKGKISILNPMNDIKQMTVYNSIGKSVYSTKNISNSIDLSFLSEGIYLIEFRSEGNIFIELSL